MSEGINYAIRYEDPGEPNGIVELETVRYYSVEDGMATLCYYPDANGHEGTAQLANMIEAKRTIPFDRIISIEEKPWI